MLCKALVLSAFRAGVQTTRSSDSHDIVFRLESTSFLTFSDKTSWMIEDNRPIPDRAIPVKSSPELPFVVCCYLLVRFQRWLIIRRGLPAADDHPVTLPGHSGDLSLAGGSDCDSRLDVADLGQCHTVTGSRRLLNGKPTVTLAVSAQDIGDNGPMTKTKLIIALVTFFALAPISSAQHSVELIAFQSSRNGSTHVFTMNPLGSDIKQLTTTAYNVVPVISPDGSKIAFMSDRDGEYYVYIMDIDGGNQRRISNAPGEEDGHTWSPDGSRIYFRKSIDGKNTLCVTDVSGGDFRQFNIENISIRSPKISPDGKKILFNPTPKGHFELWVMNSDGIDVHRIAPSINWGNEPCWSPDGSLIAYAYYEEEPSPFSSGPVEIHVCSAAGTDDRAVTDLGTTSEFPCWSPEGNRIAFQTFKDGNFEVYIVNIDGTKLKRMTENETFDGRPNWGTAK
jgi:TolB protein